ncbi:C40 family peptidase [Leeuwenhoekiella marinoflava]|uniref:NlpC/P60 family protein n=2 Tax=Leeuwenhoekiella marinoflava TaxID=988 RepID=A0A4Q0P286_9FLAO|nr:C40 family peptidase [Leeuwenhoekiella marinoflava]RXG20650.1 NlpC/P60 family protein [Leeuwenhoekiella marinoflava]SHG06916.1 NlpC/P60 family protein [Leeuwenhoekiella marinoflava DSM 3653]
MNYGICPLSIVPMRLEPADAAEMVNQVLYGEHFKVLEIRKKWSRIRLAHDKYEGWVDNKQYKEITEENYSTAEERIPLLASDLLQMATSSDSHVLSLPLGAQLANLDFTGDHYEGNSISDKKEKSAFINTALLYLKSPYLWGGRTPFGLDCSGFTQMVYRLNGHALFRDASQQCAQGEALSFIEESEPGDLAFFDNDEGRIVHVGIMLQDNYIIHCHGEVRIDRIDHTGIYNVDRRTHTHKLRVIKRIL